MGSVNTMQSKCRDQIETSCCPPTAFPHLDEDEIAEVVNNKLEDFTSPFATPKSSCDLCPERNTT